MVKSENRSSFRFHLVTPNHRPYPSPRMDGLLHNNVAKSNNVKRINRQISLSVYHKPGRVRDRVKPNVLFLFLTYKII